jgi:hypothetical protein
MTRTHKNLEHLALPLVLQESLLPRTQGATEYTREYGNVCVSVSGGVSRGKRIPLPSGIIARRILYWSITKARASGSREVKIHGSPRFLQELSLSATSSRRRALKTQLIRLVHTSITVEEFPSPKSKEDPVITIPSVPLFECLYLGDVIYTGTKEEQLPLFKSSIVFSERFYKSVVELPHQPINKDALFSLQSPLASDIYLWVQRRGQTINYQQEFSWGSMYQQFAQPKETKSNFRKSFTNAIGSINEVTNKFSNSVGYVNDKGFMLQSLPQQHYNDTNKSSRQQAQR